MLSALSKCELFTGIREGGVDDILADPDLVLLNDVRNSLFKRSEIKLIHRHSRGNDLPDNILS